MEYTFSPAPRRRTSRPSPSRSTTPSTTSTPSDRGSSMPRTNPFDKITPDNITQQQQQSEQHQQNLEVQELDPAESAEHFDLRPPLQISGRGQLLMWKNCMAHVYHSNNDTLPGEQVPLGDGKCIVPHGTSVWLAGRTGSIKQRAAMSP